MTEENEFTEYRVFWGSSPETLGRIVTQKMAMGWVLAGNMCAIYDPKDYVIQYMQPMIHF